MIPISESASAPSVVLSHPADDIAVERPMLEETVRKKDKRKMTKLPSSSGAEKTMPEEGARLGSLTSLRVEDR